MQVRYAGIFLIAIAIAACSGSEPMEGMDPATPRDDDDGPVLHHQDGGIDGAMDPDGPDPRDGSPDPSDTSMGDGTCPAEDLGSVTGIDVVTGTTMGLADALRPTLCGSPSASGPDIGYRWVAPETGMYTFDTIGTEWDTLIHVHRDTCAGVELACNDDVGGAASMTRLELNAGAAVVIVVDGYSAESFGAFRLSISLNLADSEEGVCFDGVDNDRDGDLDCSDWDCDELEDCHEKNCTDGVDDDMDARIDCADYDCYDSDECTETDTECADMIDNDGDGAVDCADYDCEELDSCHETICNDGIDNESDGDIDCADYDCYDEPSCIESMCGNGVDDEGDGVTDCADYDCWDAPECTEDGAECTDGADNDGDGRSDCADYDCRDEDPCMEHDCTNGVDDDGDGVLDCDDYDCDENEACSEIACADGADNDGDTLVDCADYDCGDDPACMEECSNGVDDNDDGAIDCDDYDCYRVPFCAEAGMCTGGTDDDGDGSADCADSECRCDLACASDSCPGTDLGSAVGMSVASGTNTAACGFRSGGCAGDGHEVSYTWTAPSTGRFTFDTVGSEYDTVLYLLDGGTCSGAELVCNDDFTGLTSEVSVMLTAGQRVVIVVDAYGTYSNGAYALNIRGS